jgi:DNA-binding GntR family transcriptional regulator
MAKAGSRPDVSRRKFLAGIAVAGAASTASTTKAASPGTTAADLKRLPSAVMPTRYQIAAETGALLEPTTQLPGRPASDFMLDVIKSLKVEYVYSNPASSFRGLHESMINYGKNLMPEFITVTHEESAVAMCQGYYKASGKPQMAMVDGVVGLQHACMAIYNAWADRVPLIVVGGNHLDAAKRAPGVLRSEPNRGYFLDKDATQITAAKIRAPASSDPEDKDYFQIAEDRLSGRLPDRVSENELMRLYKLPRSRLLKILYRIADEGWVERLPGNGWQFRATLASRESYEEAYQFRASIESEAILLPSFQPDLKAFEHAREEQTEILKGGYQTMSRARLFEINCQFHEMLAGCSQNDFFLDAVRRVRRVNRLRRLIEYRITVNRARLPRQTREHLKILTLLEAGKQQEASKFLRVHILGASAIKSSLLA